MRLRRLRRSELPVPSAALARFLIGKTLVRITPGGRMLGRIVETEAYLPHDAACHAFRGMTRRNHALFMERGHAYVYFIYGNHFMLNVSGEEAGIGGGVLLRALEPLQGLDLMRKQRGEVPARDLTRGPGRLAQALKVDMRFEGADLCAPGPLWLGTSPGPVGRIGRSVRIGISKDAHRRLRFYERRNAYVSGPSALRR
jgi:DNA-3-methyladenine glycosylase